MLKSIVLIDPGFLGEYGIGQWGKTYWASAINHGVAQIAGICKAHGINVCLMDLRHFADYAEFEETIAMHEETWYAITCRTVDVPVVENIIAIIRRQKPTAKIVIGGIHVSLVPEMYVSDERVDYVFLGEADVTLPDLLSNPANYSKIVKGKVPDINKIPFENINVYDYEKSISFSLYGGIVKAPMIPIITSRGCVYNCKFCQPAERILYGARYRQKTVERIMDEIRAISALHNFNSIMFYDDCILGQKKTLYNLLDRLASFKKMEIMLQGRADNICQWGDEIKLLRDRGLKAVVVGFESGSQRMLDFLGKGTTVEQNIRAGEILHKNGIKIVGNFMIGLPMEQREEMDATALLAEKIRPTIASCSFYSPMPGSYIYDYCKEHDLIIEKNYDKLSRDPRQPKIKMVDYSYANAILPRIVGSRFRCKFVKAMVGYAYKNLERGIIREAMTRIYNRVVN